MRLLERPVEFLLLQSEVPTDHDGTATCEISGKIKQRIVLSFLISNNHANRIIYKMCNILQRQVCGNGKAERMKII